MLKNLVILSAFSTFAVIVIIGLNIFHTYTLSSLPQTTQIHVIPIPSSFDKKTLNELKKRAPIKVSIDGKSEVVSEDSKSTTVSPTPSIPVTGRVASQSATPVITVAPLSP